LLKLLVSKNENDVVVLEGECEVALLAGEACSMCLNAASMSNGKVLQFTQISMSLDVFSWRANVSLNHNVNGLRRFLAHVLRVLPVARSAGCSRAHSRIAFQNLARVLTYLLVFG
jgi:hypothetical protein